MQHRKSTFSAVSKEQLGRSRARAAAAADAAQTCPAGRGSVCDADDDERDQAGHAERQRARSDDFEVKEDRHHGCKKGAIQSGCEKRVSECVQSKMEVEHTGGQSRRRCPWVIDRCTS